MVNEVGKIRAERLVSTAEGSFLQEAAGIGLDSRPQHADRLSLGQRNAEYYRKETAETKPAACQYVREVLRGNIFRR